MQMKISFAPAGALVTLFFLVLTGSANAQTTTPVAAPAKAPAVVAVPYCDDLLPTVKKTLTATANGKCATQLTTCECIERKSGLKIQAHVNIQPVDAKCKPLTVVEPTFANLPASGPDALPWVKPSWNPVVLQSNCTKSGTSLEVHLPGYDLAKCDKGKFTFSWDVDGKSTGTGSKVECVCGKEVKVNIKEVATGTTSTQTIKLNACTGDK